MIVDSRRAMHIYLKEPHLNYRRKCFESSDDGGSIDYVQVTTKLGELVPSSGNIIYL
jgi:hypothetical protein